jgi:aldehyde dehydrogenase (NAD+)
MANLSQGEPATERPSAGGDRMSPAVRELLAQGALHDDGHRPRSAYNVLEVIDPTTEDTLAVLPKATTTEVDAAVMAARRAFDEGPWPRLSARERGRALHRLADCIAAHGDEFAEIGALDVGSPLTLARGLHAGAPAEFFRWFADAALRGPGGSYEHSLGQNLDRIPTTSSLFYEPVGVVAAIAAYNYPLMITAFKVGGALAAGCTAVLMPSPRAPLACIAFMRMLQEAEIPDGVVNLVTGDAGVGRLLTEHPGVDMVSFTGSVEVGRSVMTQAAGGLKKVVLELGGKSPNILLSGADIEAAVPPSVLRFTRNSGQGCGATTRTLVPRAEYGRFVDAASEFMRTLKVGDPFDDETQLGPLIDGVHRDRVLGFVHRALEDGGEIVAGGGELEAGRGFFVNPVMIGGVDPDAEICQEEVFGPVAVVLPYDTVDEAIAIANGTNYGLNASVWGPGPEAMQVARQVRSGTVVINGGGADRTDVPWGGFKHSGIGYDRGDEGFREFFVAKHIQWPI